MKENYLVYVTEQGMAAGAMGSLAGLGCHFIVYLKFVGLRACACVCVRARACFCLTFYHRRPNHLWSSPALSCNGCRNPGSFPGRNVKSTTHHHFVSTLGMRGAMPLFLLYAFRAWTGTLTLPVDTACISLKKNPFRIPY